uniref:Uncharacterized protein n=1 Tax=Oryza barthii TaxID=65489 RepID=A0A0D3FZQ3_9ORYZ
MDSTSTSPRGLPLITNTAAAKQSNRATLIEIVNCGALNHPVQDHPSLTQRHPNVFQMHWLAVTVDSEDLLFLRMKAALQVPATLADVLLNSKVSSCELSVGMSTASQQVVPGHEPSEFPLQLVSQWPLAEKLRLCSELVKPVATSVLRSEKKNGVSVKFVGPIPVLPTAGRPLRS